MQESQTMSEMLAILWATESAGVVWFTGFISYYDVCGVARGKALGIFCL